MSGDGIGCSNETQERCVSPAEDWAKKLAALNGPARRPGSGYGDVDPWLVACVPDVAGRGGLRSLCRDPWLGLPKSLPDLT